MKRVLAFLLLAGSVHGQTITDPGFEVPKQGDGKFTYRPPGSAWTFAGDTGLAGNGSAFTSGNPNAPQGGQVALVQKIGRVAQTVTGWPAGTYQVSLQAAQRGNYAQGGTQQLNVTLDGQAVTTITPGGKAYQTYYSAPFTVTAGDHVIGLAGLVNNPDSTAFVDVIQVIPAGSVPATATAAARVASSGKMIEITFAENGKPVIPTQFLTPPMLAVNGQPIGTCGTGWITGYHPLVLMATPENYQIRHGDVVQVSAEPGWAFVASGAVAPLSGAPCENRTGKPMAATESFPRRLRIGVNNAQNPTSYSMGFYSPLKNFKYRVGWPPGTRGKMLYPPWFQSISLPATNNYLDGTKYPGIRGLWLVVWDAAKPATPVQFSITTGTPGQCTVTERADLRVTPADGVGHTRVFDVQPIAVAPSADFDVALRYEDQGFTGTANYENLWIVQPGDWSIVDGKAVLDRSDPWALSPLYVERTGLNVGILRWTGASICGGNPISRPYPELLQNETDENWGDLSFYSEVRGYTECGPVDVNKTPWIYSPYFREAGQSYTATLGADVATAPARGTSETWTIPDGATAPLMAGLTMRIDAEDVRILSGSGTAWKVYRGSNGTTPATHQAGPLTVSGRRPISSMLNGSGLSPQGTVYQLTMREPHGRTTGDGFACYGSGWPNMKMTDGTTVNLQGFGWQGYVTGPNTFFFRMGGPPAGTTPSQVYALDPSKQQWDYRTMSGIPVEVTARITGRFPRADLIVNIPLDACDDEVFEIARRVRDNFPAGRRVYVEYCNEPWNNAFSSYFYCAMMSGMVVPGEKLGLAYYPFRAAQCGTIFRKVFGDRAGEIHVFVNCQMASGSTQVTPYLEYGLRLGTPFDAVGVAPYWSLEDTPYNREVTAKLDDDQLVDVVMADFRTNPRLSNPWMKSVTDAIASYNKAHGASVKLIGYEGSIEHTTKWDTARDRDVQYNPNWYFAETDWLAWCQNAGMDRLTITEGWQWWGPPGWGGYHTPQQRHGRGDGLNGGADNRANRARGKPATVNHDSRVDAVRPQAWLDWLGTLD